uniref:Uncharacterized protein n=1 Tax=Opuntia streptacantha TaxID=393608 RepID=A0A7C8ZJV1_OPUST
MMNPGACLVSSNLNLVIWVYKFHSTVTKCGQGSYFFTFLVLMWLLGIHLPNSNFTVLVCTEELVSQHYQGLHCTFCDSHHIIGEVCIIIFISMRIPFPYSDFIV